MVVEGEVVVVVVREEGVVAARRGEGWRRAIVVGRCGVVGEFSIEAGMITVESTTSKRRRGLVCVDLA